MGTYLRHRMKTLCLFLGVPLAIMFLFYQETKALSLDSYEILLRNSREPGQMINNAIKSNEPKRKKKQKKMKNKKAKKFNNRKKKQLKGGEKKKKKKKKKNGGGGKKKKKKKKKS